MLKAFYAVALLLVSSAADVRPVVASDLDKDEVRVLQRAMNDAFQSNDKDQIFKLAAPDQIAMTPFFKGPTTIQQAVQQIGKAKIPIVRSGEAKVTQLAPEVVVVNQEIYFQEGAEVDGKPIPARVYATAIWTKIDGKWRQKFYQETAME